MLNENRTTVDELIEMAKEIAISVQNGTLNLRVISEADVDVPLAALQPNEKAATYYVIHS
jgi:hypothetical protein